MWTGLVVSGVNSLIVCLIGLHTSQYGFIPANVFCICINAFSLRAWLKVQKDPSESTTGASRELLTGCKPMSNSKKAAPRRLINSFRIRSEGRLGIRSHRSLLKMCGPSHQHPLSHQHKRQGAPPLTQFHGGTGGSPQISTVLSRFPGHQSYFRIAHHSGMIFTPVSVTHSTHYAQILSKCPLKQVEFSIRNSELRGKYRSDEVKLINVT
jgi:hypothetical protein